MTGPLAEQLDCRMTGAPDGRVAAVWDHLVAQALSQETPSRLAAHLQNPRVSTLMKAIFDGSPYLQGLVTRDLTRLERVLSDDPSDHLARLIDGLHPQMAQASELADAMRLLRVFKAEAALVIALADLGRVWSVMDVTRALTEVADAAVTSAVRFLFRAASRRGDWDAADLAVPERASGYIVLAMGKYGAFELNYSSDIDLIVFFDRARHRVAARLDPATFFVRLTRELVALLSEATANGYVFRTDLRLRPDAGATQIALSTEAALHYYETVGQNWERAAFIKARPVAGDLACGRALLASLSPFLWRKYLDFAAIADIHAMKRQIHVHRGFGAIAVAGHNIKLGPGGIREIEFFVQTQQLIAGGRQPDLRSPRTLDALAALVANGWIAPNVARDLTAAYVELRRIEHRLQMVVDAQTHELPVARHDLEMFARFAGSVDLAAFSSDLLAVLYTVEAHYARLFSSAPELTARASNMVFAGAADDPATLSALAAMGYSQPSQVLATVRSWHHGRYRAMRSPVSRERLTLVQPLLIEALSTTAGPDQALANFDRFLADLPAGVQLFALLWSRPGLLQLLADIMGSAPRLARILSRRRRLFDAVIDTRTFAALPQVAGYQRLLSDAMPPDADFEAVLDAARVVGSEQAFVIGVRILAGSVTAGEAGGSYAALAEALIAALQARIECDLMKRHGGFSGGGAAVVALGKLGGREMTAASDLDLIVIYDAPDAAMTGALLSDGPMPLPAPVYYTRLAQRLVAALSAPTAEGTLYDVDLRLRPSGQKGPLATSLQSFKSYQATEAWTWEHLSLTRARVVSGAPALRKDVEDAMAAVLTRPRDAVLTASEVTTMRRRIEEEKGSTDPWDIKHVRGGSVDLEFICQYLQLIHAARHHGILDPNTRTALAKLAAHGLLDAADAGLLMGASRLYTGLIGVLRLMSDGPFIPNDAPHGLKDRLRRAAHAPSFSALGAELAETEAAVHVAFKRIVERPGLSGMGDATER